MPKDLSLEVRYDPDDLEMRSVGDVVQAGVELGRRMGTAAMIDDLDEMFDQTMEFEDDPEILQAALLWTSRIMGSMLREGFENPADVWSRFLLQKYEEGM